MKTINEIAEKYGIAPIETFKEEYTESEFYETLLNQTDFIPNKIQEEWNAPEPGPEQTE